MDVLLERAICQQLGEAAATFRSAAKQVSMSCALHASGMMPVLSFTKLCNVSNVWDLKLVHLLQGL